MSTRRFQRFFDLAKVEKLDDGSGAVRVTGILSSETPDEAGEIITADAMREAIPDYMKFGAVREMHDEIAAGVMLKVEVGDDGKTLTFISTTAEAHVITAPSDSIAPSHTTLTFGGAIGDRVSLTAFNGLWYVGDNVGVTAS